MSIAPDLPAESSIYCLDDAGEGLLSPLVGEGPAHNRDYSVEDVFNMLSAKLGGYEVRHSQLELAKEISRAFESGKTGVFEAGTRLLVEHDGVAAVFRDLAHSPLMGLSGPAGVRS